jgi:hypothetical protein
MGNKHLNPVVDLLAAKKPVFGTAIPANGGGGGGNRPGGAGRRVVQRGGRNDSSPAPTPAPTPKTPLELAKDALAHPEIDYFFSGGMERGVSTPGRNGGPAPIESFTSFANGLVEAGAIITKPAPLLRAPLAVKTPNISNAERPADPAVYVDSISKQLNAGVSIINFVEVDSVDEVTKGINAMRFASKGGTRQEAIGDAAKYWGVTRRRIAPRPTCGRSIRTATCSRGRSSKQKRALPTSATSLRSKASAPSSSVPERSAAVFSTTNAEGRCVRDAMRRGMAILTIRRACKEFKKPCGYPAYETDIEARMKQGFDVFIIQTFSERGFKAVEIGRQVSGRDKEKK